MYIGIQGFTGVYRDLGMVCHVIGVTIWWETICELP